MSTRAVAAALNLRRGEGPLFVVLGSYLFLATATVTLLIAAKNGLFLSVYPATFVPYAMILAALLTASASVAFSGLAARTPSRDALARRFLVLVAASLGACWVAFRISPASAFVIYLWLVSVNVLLLTHGWSYVGGSLTGRQGKRLMPVIGMGSSFASIVAGLALAPLLLVLGTEDVLLVAAGLVLAILALLGRVSSPRQEDAEPVGPGGRAGVRAFVESSSQGFRSLRDEPLLRLLAAAVVLVMVTSTLIDYLFKISVQGAFARDRITIVYGLLAGAIGVASLLFQLSASRVIFPRFGVSAAAMGHAGTLAVNAGAVAAVGGIPLVFLLQVMDDSLRESIERPAEQVSLLPYPRRIKEPAYTTISGVMRPLARALTAWAAIGLAMWPVSLPLAAVAAATGAMLLYTRHRRLYLEALEQALARHTVELRPFSRTPLVLDREGLKVLDEALVDPAPTVVIFAISLLPRLPVADALPLLLPRLEHPRPEVRAEAARALGSLDEEDLPEAARRDVIALLGRETEPLVLSALLPVIGQWSAPDVDARLEGFLEHPDVQVRRAALVTLGAKGWGGTQPGVIRMLSSDDQVERAAGISAVGELELAEFLPTLAQAVDSEALRPHAVTALRRLGTAAVPTLAGLAADGRRAIGVRRCAVMTLAGVDDAAMARARLVELLEDRDLAPLALKELRRLRQAGRIGPLDRATLAPFLRREADRAFRYACAAAALDGRTALPGERARWVAEELRGLRDEGMLRAMDILALVYDPQRVRAVETAMASCDADRQSSALELLEGMLEREDAALVIPLGETLMDGGGAAAIAADTLEPEELVSGPIRLLLEDDEWFPRALGLYAAAGMNGRGPSLDDLDEEAKRMIPLMQKVMVLKGSEFFRTFPGEEVAGIAQLARETHLTAGEVLFRQGDDGDAFYVVLGGSVRIVRDDHEVARLGPREGFGEMALLDDETRSATVEAAEPTTLLRIDRESFERLVEENPAIAKAIYRVLTRRLRSTLAQVGANK